MGLNRFSPKDIERAIENLNKVSKVKYQSNGAYGYTQLAVSIPNSSGCISTMSNGNTKKELYYQIQFVLDWIRNESSAHYNMNNCRHRDELNHFEGKKDISLIREYTDKKSNEKTYQCSCCRQEFTEIDFKQNHKPISYDTIRKKRDEYID